MGRQHFGTTSEAIATQTAGKTNLERLVLLAAMAVSFGTQDWIEAGVIAALVALNVSVGFSQVSLAQTSIKPGHLTRFSFRFQEWKAEKTVAALASVGAPVAQVLRDGKEVDSRVEDVVP
jgi:Na+-exporting ATPase